jgi:hypothetical protein
MVCQLIATELPFVPPRADCDIVLPLLHLSGDLKFNERDNFAISFVEETQEWSVDKVTDGGGFKESMRPACNTGALVSRQHWYNREGYFHRSLALHLTVPGSGGRFIYALPYDGLSRYETDVEELARKRGAVLKNV